MDGETGATDSRHGAGAELAAELTENARGPGGLESDAPGAAMMRLINELYPICRSITGDGLRRSLAAIGRSIPLQIHEVPSGTPVLDWIVPPEWNVWGAHISRLDGTRLVDFADHNLHLVQYSRPIDAVIPWEELKDHLHTIPEQPGWIPYRTSYYRESWGFCLAHERLAAFTDPEYRVVIDSHLAPGHLSYGECVLPGETEAEVLFSCHSCHPSLANDNLAGIAVAVMLADWLRTTPRRYTYRFLFVPGTIGSITWLARNEAHVGGIRHGLVLSCLGDAGSITYKQSRRGNAEIDRFVAHVLRNSGAAHRITPFIPYGYDERQYCSPGFNLPVGCFMRTPNGAYPEYHSSADNPAFLREEALEDSLAKLRELVGIIEGNATYRSRNPKGEPQLGRRGLYRSIGGQSAAGLDEMALLWVLNLADGEHSLFEMAERAELPFAKIRSAADALIAADLLELV